MLAFCGFFKNFALPVDVAKISLMLFDIKPFIGPGLSTTSHPINTHFYCTIYMTTQQIAIVYGLCMFRCKVVIFCIFPPLWFVPPNQSTTIMPRGRNIFEWGEGVSDRLNGKSYADDWLWSYCRLSNQRNRRHWEHSLTLTEWMWRIKKNQTHKAIS